MDGARQPYRDFPIESVSWLLGPEFIYLVLNKFNGNFIISVTLLWNLTGDLPEIKRFTHLDNSNYDWQTVVINVQNNMLKGSFKGYEENYDDTQLQSANAEIPEDDFLDLFFGPQVIYLGGMPSAIDINTKPIGDDNGATFKGCVGETRIGGFLLPFFPHDEIYLDKIRPRSHFRLNSTKPKEGCVLCFQFDCQNGGICANPGKVFFTLSLLLSLPASISSSPFYFVAILLVVFNFCIAYSECF